MNINSLNQPSAIFSSFSLNEPQLFQSEKNLQLNEIVEQAISIHNSLEFLPNMTVSIKLLTVEEALTRRENACLIAETKYNPRFYQMMLNDMGNNSFSYFLINGVIVLKGICTFAPEDEKFEETDYLLELECDLKTEYNELAFADCIEKKTGHHPCKNPLSFQGGFFDIIQMSINQINNPQFFAGMEDGQTIMEFRFPVLFLRDVDLDKKEVNLRSIQLGNKVDLYEYIEETPEEQYQDLKIKCEKASIVILGKANIIQRLIYKKNENGQESIVLEKGVLGKMLVIGSVPIQELIKTEL